MKYFLDTEFIEDGKHIDLISIGIVAQDGRSYYRQNDTCVFQHASDWVWRNVFPHLEHFNLKGEKSCQGVYRDDSLSNSRRSFCGTECPWRDRYEIRDELKVFLDIEKYGTPEIWGYYADYDWVVFCQLFGPMIALPKGFPMYCRDIKQLCDAKGNPPLPANTSSAHHALADALWTKQAYEFLTE